MMPHVFRVLAAAILLIVPVLAQRKVGPQNWGERVLLIVPMVGAGTYQDPRRPLGCPTPGDARTVGVVSYRFEISDDGRSALVEITARDRAALAVAMAPSRNRGDVRTFEKGLATKAEIETEFKARRRDFDLDRFVRATRDNPAAVGAR